MRIVDYCFESFHAIPCPLGRVLSRSYRKLATMVIIANASELLTALERPRTTKPRMAWVESPLLLPLIR